MNTTNKFAALLRDCAPPAKWRPDGDPVLIYGAGNTGQKVAAYLKTQGAEIAGFLDAKAQPEQVIDGLPVSTLQDWLSRHDPSHYEVFIAISNPVFLPEIPKLRRQISASGFAQCTYRPFVISGFIYPDFVAPHFENAKQCCEHSLPELVRLDGILADEESRQCLVGYVRAHCQEEEVKSHHIGDDYRPVDLPAWPQPLRFIDCGAFTGDTLADFIQHGYRFDAIAAFEPDQENFRHLVSNTTQYQDIIRFPCAIGGRTTTVHFDASNDVFSHINYGGGGRIYQKQPSRCNALPWTKYCPLSIRISSKWISKARNRKRSWEQKT